MQTAPRTITAILPNREPSADSAPRVRYAPYCRVSSDSSDQELSFAAQVKYYTEMVGKMENAELVDVYADEAISGRGTKKREDFNRLIADCKKGRIDRVITKSVSRFARNTVDCLETVRLLARYGVSVLFEKEGIDTADMPSEVLLAMSGTQAQDESISHGNNMRWSYETRMKKGEFLGCCPAYGYALISSSEHVIHPEEAKVVNQIKDMYLQGSGKQKIADYLNQNGVTNRGRKWTAFAIDYILNNERYVGDALLQKHITTNEWPPRKILNDGSRPQYYVENALPAIWTREEREAILALEASRRNTDTTGGGHALSRMLVCGECGHTFRRIKRKSGIVWGCAYSTSGRSKCSGVTLPETDVCAAFLRCVNTLCCHREEILLPLITRMETLQSKRNGTQVKIWEIDQQIASLSKQSLVIADLLASGILETADFAAQSNALGDKINALRSQRRTLLKQNENDDLLAELHELKDTLDDMDGEITVYDEDLIRSVIQYATVLSDTELRIHIKGGLEVTEQLPQYYTRRCRRK